MSDRDEPRGAARVHDAMGGKHPAVGMTAGVSSDSTESLVPLLTFATIEARIEIAVEALRGCVKALENSPRTFADELEAARSAIKRLTDVASLIQPQEKARLPEKRVSDVPAATRAMIDRFDVHRLTVADRPPSAKRDQLLGELDFIREQMIRAAEGSAVTPALTSEHVGVEDSSDPSLPGMDWTLSDETKAQIDAIEGNQRMAHAMANTIRIGGAGVADDPNDHLEVDAVRLARIEAQMLQHGGVDSHDVEWMAGMTRTAIGLSAVENDEATIQLPCAVAKRHAVELEQCSIFAADVGASIAKAMTDCAADLRSALSQSAKAKPAKATHYLHEIWSARPTRSGDALEPDRRVSGIGIMMGLYGPELDDQARSKMEDYYRIEKGAAFFVIKAPFRLVLPVSVAQSDGSAGSVPAGDDTGSEGKRT